MAESRSTSRWGRVPAWWLQHPAVDADGFCVLAALATYADEHGVCIPSQATLALHLRRSRPWVNRVVAQLAAAGLLDKTARSRGNGGTTSCLYRLRLVPEGGAPDEALPPARPIQAAFVADVTGHVPHADAPCQAGDTEHLYPEHNSTPAPRATTPTHDADAEVPADWEPSAADASEALRLCPGVNLPAHTARFRARCRARGYRYRAGHLGDAWLAWLLEDHGPPPRCGAGRTPGPSRASPSPAPPSPVQRFAAWAASAAVPPAPAARPWS